MLSKSFYYAFVGDKYELHFFENV